MLNLLTSILAVLVFGLGQVAADPSAPNFWDLKERLPKQDLGGVERLRFLTTVDFPPFNYLDADGRLTGYHVDLARRICSELDILDKCQIQALPWAELQPALDAGEGEAIIAGLPVTAEHRNDYAFSRPYLKFPARFVVAADVQISEPLSASLDEKRVGVIAGSTHETMLRRLFPGVRAVTYSRAEWLQDDVRERKIDAAFGDGMRFSFWLAGADAKACCRFAGGPYLNDDYLGQGLAIAVLKENSVLADAFNYAMLQIQEKGGFTELYLRYFPVGYF
ncbi:MAG: transporter substrate-binding domain-containing protein [Mesorhizobium sp.]